jgi:hypothetical protein
LKISIFAQQLELQLNYELKSRSNDFIGNWNQKNQKITTNLLEEFKAAEILMVEQKLRMVNTWESLQVDVPLGIDGCKDAITEDEGSNKDTD